MGYLILVRHGAPCLNPDDWLYGWIDIPLSRKGIEEALDCAFKLENVELDLAFASNLFRTQETLSIILSGQKKTEDLGYPHEIWSQRLLARHIRKNCIKEAHPDLLKISQGTISKILNASNIKPHKIKSYTAKVDPDFDTKESSQNNLFTDF